MDACSGIGADFPEIPGLHLDPIVVGQSHMHWYLWASRFLMRGLPPPKMNVTGWIHPRKLTCPLKRGHFKRKVVFQPLFFRDMLVLGNNSVQDHALSLASLPMTADFSKPASNKPGYEAIKGSIRLTMPLPNHALFIFLWEGLSTVLLHLILWKIWN